MLTAEPARSRPHGADGAPLPAASPRRERVVRLVAALALAWGGAYLVWRVGWSGDGAHPVLFALLLLAEAFGWASLGLYAFLTWRPRQQGAVPVPARARTVDVLVCTYDEPLDVLRATLLGCRALRHPHTTWLLDDGRRPHLAALAEELGARYLTRPDNTHAKAGNVNAALGRTTGELVAVLDADHVPLPHFLDRVVGYFDDERVALVQTPHEFLNRDSVQHTARGNHEQELFFRVVCPGKDRHNAAFWCGSGAVLRRTALEGVGGVRHDTVAEDFHTTIAMHQQGWVTRYHHEVLVHGRAPHDLGAFLLQRDRWARGNLRVLRTPESPLTAPGLTLAQRVSYAASLLNYFSGPQRLLLLAVLAATLLTGELPMQADVPALAALWAPWALLSTAATVALARGRLATFDSTRYGLMTAGIFTVATLSLLSSGTGRFKVTPKEGVDRGGAIVLRQLWLLVGLGAALAAAAGARALATLGVLPLAPMPALAVAASLTLAGWELAHVGRLVRELVQRRQQRAEYRQPVGLAARLGDAVVRVTDITPTGVALLVARPLEPGETVRLTVTVPRAGGGTDDLVLPLEVRSCVVFAEATWRVGLQLGAVPQTVRDVLIEYCHVVAPAPVRAPHRGGRAGEAVATRAA